MREVPLRGRFGRASILALALVASPAGAQEPREDPHAGRGADDDGITMPASTDGSSVDASLPPGTIVVTVKDGEGRPLVDTDVTLGMLYNSVAKGESRKRVERRPDAEGNVRFDALDVGSGVAYRISVLREGGTFAIAPFQLPAERGVRARLTVHPVTRQVEQALIVNQAVVYAEVKDDRVQLEQAFRIYNFGKVAWVPEDLVIALPPEFTAFTTQQGMSDITAEAVPKRGVRVRGTFGPGQHVVQFRFQLPYQGTAEVPVETGLLPNTAAMRVIAPAARGILLDAPGFPAAQSTADGSGQRALITEKQLRREDPPPKALAFTLRGLPTEGPGKLIATALAGAGVAAGLVLGSRKGKAGDPKAERARLLEELEALERGKASGEVGPKTYARARREIVDALARTFRDAPPKAAAKAASKASRPRAGSST